VNLPSAVPPLVAVNNAAATGSYATPAKQNGKTNWQSLPV